MTNQPSPERSLYDEHAATKAGPLSLAAATLAMRVSRLLHGAKSASKMSSKQIAERMDISEGRVSQVLNGDGNVHIATLARFMRAMGYMLEVVAVPLDSGKPVIQRPAL
jgi:transcriptional regulator with XRE-family HTH domain